MEEFDVFAAAVIAATTAFVVAFRARAVTLSKKAIAAYTVGAAGVAAAVTAAVEAIKA